MPLIRRRPKQRRAGFDTPRTCWRLLTGQDWAFLDDRSKLTDEELALAWQQQGALIVQVHVFGAPGGDDFFFRHVEAKPLTRPWGWWEFEAPQPRRLIGGTQDPTDGFPPWNTTGKRWYFYGIPNPTRGAGGDAEYEEEADYLRRLRLLLPEEKKSVRAGKP